MVTGPGASAKAVLWKTSGPKGPFGGCENRKSLFRKMTYVQIGGRHQGRAQRIDGLRQMHRRLHRAWRHSGCEEAFSAIARRWIQYQSPRHAGMSAYVRSASAENHQPLRRDAGGVKHRPPDLPHPYVLAVGGAEAVEVAGHRAQVDAVPGHALRRRGDPHPRTRPAVGQGLADDPGPRRRLRGRRADCAASGCVAGVRGGPPCLRVPPVLLGESDEIVGWRQAAVSSAGSRLAWGR